jgi:hypothetical protein
MSGRQLEVADVFRLYGAAYLDTYGHRTSNKQRQVLRNIVNCRTSALGGHVKKCDKCGHKEVYFNSCRDRHCPKCQAAARAEWLEARAQGLLPGVEYFHIVFTLPDRLNSVAIQNKRLMYAILFRASSEALLTIAHDPKHLGAQIGFLSVLHTWSQRLQLHPHVHCVVPGGGISPDGKQWISSRKDFFLPVRVLSSLFQKKFLYYLAQAFSKGELSLRGSVQHFTDAHNWKQFVGTLNKSKWVVYAKPPFGSADRVLKYLARYTHRVAITNQRLIDLENGKVKFSWKDYANGNVQRTMSLDAVEFIRRFLLHTLPSGFTRIRYYGFLSNRNRNEKLALCRELIPHSQEIDSNKVESSEATVSVSQEYENIDRCPACKEGRMRSVEAIEPDQEMAWSFASRVLRKDTG